MLVLLKFLRLFVNTLTDDEKYSLLYRENLTQPIQILLTEKQIPFSYFSSSILKSTLHFEHFQKKDDPHSRCCSQITVSEKVVYINACKFPFERCLPQQTSQKGPETVGVCTAVPLPYLFIPLEIIKLEKIYVSGLQILKSVS